MVIQVEVGVSAEQSIYRRGSSGHDGYVSLTFVIIQFVIR